MSSSFRKSSTDATGTIAGLFGSTALPDGGKPKAGESTGPQNVGVGAGAPMGIQAALYQQAGGGPLGAPGVGGVFPGGLPGIGIDMNGWGMVGWNGGNFVQPRRGTYATYRIMGMDPTYALLRNLTYNPIIASQWSVQPAEGIEIDETGKTFTFDKISGKVTKVPKWAVEFISGTILPQRQGIIREALRYREFGFRPFERVYEMAAGMPGGGKFYNLAKLKPLLPEFVTILNDEHGNFGGMTTGGGSSLASTGGNAMAPNKSWICSHDVEAGNLYGLSVYEMGYEPWIDIQRTRIKQLMLMGKLSGVLPTLYYRPGMTPINGKLTDNYEIAKQIVAVAFAGGAACVPTTEYSDTDLQQNPELAALAPWKLEIVNAGSYAPAMDGMIRERQYQNTLQCMALGWPSRSVLEAQQAGSRADSETHTQSASLLLENLDDDIASQVSCGQPMYGVPGVVDELLRLNFGDGTEGSIIVKPAPLSDPKVALYTDIIKTLLGNPKIAPIITQGFDLVDMLSHLDIKTPEDFKERLPELLKELQEQAMQPAPAPGGKTPITPTGRMGGGGNLLNANGNGKAKAAADDN